VIYFESRIEVFHHIIGSRTKRSAPEVMLLGGPGVCGLNASGVQSPVSHWWSCQYPNNKCYQVLSIKKIKVRQSSTAVEQYVGWVVPIQGGHSPQGDMEAMMECWFIFLLTGHGQRQS
jgi:hypothetical protein